MGVFKVEIVLLLKVHTSDYIFNLYYTTIREDTFLLNIIILSTHILFNSDFDLGT